MTTYVVNTLADENDGINVGGVSLRDAIAAASANHGPDTITFDPALTSAGPATITLINGPLTVANPEGTDSPTTITGPGPDQLTIDGNGSHHVFDVEISGNVLPQLNISGLTIRGAVATGTKKSGGAIFNNGPVVSIDSCVITGNSADGSGAGVYNSGDMTITNSEISNNTSGRDGGGIFNNGSLVARNDTISENTAARGGGLFQDIGSSDLHECTIAANSAGSSDGGGVFVNSTPSLQTDLLLTNTLISNNLGAIADVSGPVASSSHSLISDGNGVTGIVNGQNGNIVGGSDADVIQTKLLDLGNYGGPTRTMGLQPGSPAIDAGIGSSSFSTDQRGSGFPRVFASAIDIGAFEYQGKLPPTDIALSGNSLQYHYTSAGQVVASISTTDPDSTAFTYQLVTGDGSTDNNKFQINDGVLSAAVDLASDSNKSYIIRIRSTDSDGLFFEKVFSISVQGSYPGIKFATQPTNQVAGKKLGKIVVNLMTSSSAKNAADRSPVAIRLLNASDEQPASQILKIVKAKKGSAVFSGLTIRTAGTYELEVYSQGQYVAGYSSSFTVSPAPSKKLVFSQIPATVTHGQPFTAQVMLTDSYGNSITAPSQVTLTLGKQSGGLALGGTPSSALSRGRATFSDLVIVPTPGTFILLAADGKLKGKSGNIVAS